MSRCGLCKHYHYDFELNEDWCNIDNEYLNTKDCPNFEEGDMKYDDFFDTK